MDCGQTTFQDVILGFRNTLINISHHFSHLYRSTMNRLVEKINRLINKEKQSFVYVNDVCLCLVIHITKVTVIHCIANIIIYVPIVTVEVLCLRDIILLISSYNIITTNITFGLNKNFLWPIAHSLFPCPHRNIP